MSTSGEPTFPPDHQYWDQLKPLPRDAKPLHITVPLFPGLETLKDEDIKVTLHTADEAPLPDPAWADPRLWDAPPNGVTHIAGAQMVMFGRYLRQRCEWCGIILLEYDLARVAVPEGTDPMPAMWTPMALVRVDGHISAEIVNPAKIEEGIQLPTDCCAFDPTTQVA